MSDLFKHTRGPRNAKIAIVGEAFGEQEEKTGAPFMGASGQELGRMLASAGISQSSCFMTNVLNLRPPNNDIAQLCVPKSEVGKDYKSSALSMGKYLPVSYFHHIARLHDQLRAVNPNIVLALGNTACWALLGSTGIGSLRGVVAQSPIGLKVLPTYHPSAILRNWSLRVIAIADMLKAEKESKFPEVIRPKRKLLVYPTLDEIRAELPRFRKASHCAVDIETKRLQITCIGFAPSSDFAMVVPFCLEEDKVWRSFWPTLEEELEAWGLVKELLLCDSYKIFQNGMYDLQYIMKMGLQVKNCYEDTMLMHHSMYPEMQKGLGFLGSVYTNEASWKMMRRRNDELKADA